MDLFGKSGLQLILVFVSWKSTCYSLVTSIIHVTDVGLNLFFSYLRLEH